MHVIRLFILCCCFALPCRAQDEFVGTWQMVPIALEDTHHIHIQIEVSAPEKKLLYPAQVSIQYKDFFGKYLLLLARQENRLAISRDKFALSEMPYTLGAWPIVWNGYLVTDEAKKDLLNVQRIKSKKFGIPLPAIMSYAEANRADVLRITDFLKSGKMQFRRTSPQAWTGADARKLLFSTSSPAYLGLIDSFFTNKASANIRFAENNRPDNDSITLTLNGKILMQNMNLNAPATASLELNRGTNLLLLFAENFGSVPPNTAKLNIRFDDKQYWMDFTDAPNMSSTFIAAKIFYSPEDHSNQAQQQRSAINGKISGRQTKVIDSIPAASAEITLAIWDDALEDGDSISLKINDDIYMPGLAVKKRPQFIPVTLKRGENTILFIADNLGSISPNTAVLEIIDGKKRRAYMINTNLGVNNAIKISYDFGAGN